MHTSPKLNRVYLRPSARWAAMVCLAVGLLLGVGAFKVNSSRARAAGNRARTMNTIVVNDSSGDRGGPGCKLRDALEAAMTDMPRGGCAAGNGDDTIVLPDGVNILLTARDNSDHGANGLPAITSGVTIIGGGSTIQRSAAAEKFRFFYVAPGGRLELRNVYLRDGYAQGGAGGRGPSDDGGGGGGGAGLGGAIYNRGMLAVLNSTLAFNAAAGGAGGVGGRGVRGVNDNSAGGGGGGGGVSGNGGDAAQGDDDDFNGGGGGGGTGGNGGGVG
ncbi:MAG: hypothetical protein ABI977_23345, partial [Acidobacteriota bacterium]